ncbi:Phospholipid scramblase 2 [Holothuria leucospilota]|uniref:Phospholipid scramblase n=1 Tax=Holothuria leucospilota TaxID=206669 RepID=A0A9Q1HKH5_HOLLE|nr:Phospholipid scramblase 2 [Holothuria leucospilota]
MDSTKYGVKSESVTVTVPPAPAPPPGQPLPGQQVVQWMPQPEKILGCPPGLEYLTQLDQILVHQQVELLEAFTGWETKNKYQVKNALGQQIFFAAEESGACMRQCCGSERGFTMHVVDNSNQEVLRVVRPFQCCAGCCWCADCCECCAFTISVESPPGQTIGFVRQRASAWKPYYDVLDANSEVILKIRGPCCPCQTICCRGDVDFNVLSVDESQNVGRISKQWAGITKEWFTKADNFGITFPMDLDVKAKGTLMGALFLIEFMYFEEEDN